MTTILERALSRMPGFVLDADGADRELLEAIAVLFQAASDDSSALVSQRDIEVAEGIFLDRIGRELGEAREGLEDVDFRVILRGALASRNSDGTETSVALVARLMFGTDDVQVLDRPPGAVNVIVATSDPVGVAARARTRRLLERAVLGGVRVDDVVETDAAGYFGWHGDPDALGFDDGALAEVW